MRGPLPRERSTDRKRRWANLLILVLLAASTGVSAMSVFDPLAGDWALQLCVAGIGMSVLAFLMVRSGAVDGAILVIGGTISGLVGWMHLTYPSADTAPYYLLPLMLLSLLLLDAVQPWLLIGATLLYVVGLRAGNGLPEPFAFGHTVDLVFVLLATGALAALVRRDWSRMEDLRTTLRSLERAEGEQRRLRELAEEADQAKSRFLANMSHELRTPLNAAFGYAELLEEEVEGVEPRADGRRIQAAGRHLLGIVDDVLDLARIETGGRTPVLVASHSGR